MTSWGSDQGPRPALSIDERGTLIVGGQRWAVALPSGAYTLTYVLGSAGFVRVELTEAAAADMRGVTELRVYADGLITAIIAGGEVERDRAGQP